MKTKALSLFLVLTLVISLVPMTTLAAGPFQTAPACTHEKTHTVQTIVEATCTKGGYIHDAKVCDGCGEEVAAKDYPLTEAAGHNWKDGKCLDCGEASAFQPAPKCEHESQNVVNNNDGTHKFICGDCGLLMSSAVHSYNEYDVCVCGAIKPYCAHEKTHTKQTIVEATCTEDGYIHDAKICDDCGEEVSAKDYPLTEAAGHKWENGVCTVCGEKSPFETAPKCQHEMTHTKQTIVEATCTEDGYIHDAKICDSCGEEVSGKDYPLEAAGHKWENGVCTVCGEKSPFETAPKCQHESQDLVSNGVWTHNVVCSDCEEVLSTSRHQYNFFTHVCACGAVDPMYQFMCPHNHHHLVNNGSNHKVVCDHCKFVHYYEPHGYNDSGVCSCGAIKPACLHSRFDTVNNGANHNIVCYDCGIVIFAEAHSYNAYDMCICGAVNPNVVPEVIPEEPAPIYPDDAWQRLDELFTTFK